MQTLSIIRPLAVCVASIFWTQHAPADWRFERQEFATGLGVGYAVVTADVNRDKKPDLVVVDRDRVRWYENPTWRERRIAQSRPTERDNVCVAPVDVDRDGYVDLVLGADWGGLDTRSGGTLQWLRNPGKTKQAWNVYPIGSEPTLHRVRAIDVSGDGRPEVVLAPLMGRDSSRKGNWMDGRPVRLLAYDIPADPTRATWQPRVLSDSLHVVHNFCGVDAAGRRGSDLLAASYEGVSRVSRAADGTWKTALIGRGDQATPNRRRGSSEVKMGRAADGKRFIATVEPWHGDKVVVYTEPAAAGQLWERRVIDRKLKWGHAVRCADLDGDGGDELIVGARDDLSRRPGERRGVRVYKPADKVNGAWRRTVIESGGVAVEDLTAADLDGDGRVDIVAAGRQTGNGRIYWNRSR